MPLPDIINDRINLQNYQFDYQEVLTIAESLDSIELNIAKAPKTHLCKHRHRNDQTNELLLKLENSFIPYNNPEWLQKRNISPYGIYSIDYSKLSRQDQLDLQLYPNDYILDTYGERPIDGPVFEDRRNNKLIGVCVRNTSKDQNYAAAEKYTISNYGWYLYGYDLYKPNDEVYIVEGVFDAIAMRQHGYNAIGLATAYPTAFQLACLTYKFNNLRLCLDNDFWGHAGSYIISKALNIPIYFTELKDPGCYTTERTLTLKQSSHTVLWDTLEKEIIDYNKLIENGHEFVRPLPYN